MAAIEDLNCTLPQIFNREPCSGNGQCSFETGLCECFPGWTGRSGIFNTEGRDCQINETAIQAIWGLVLAICLVTIVPIMRRLIERWAQFKRNQRSRLREGRKVSIFENKGLLSVLCHVFGLFPALVTLSVLKLSRPYGRIGLNWPETIAFFLVRVTITTMIAIFQPALIKSFLRGSRSKTLGKQKILIKLSERFAVGNIFVSFGATLIPFASIGTQGEPSLKTLRVFQCYFAFAMLYLLNVMFEGLYIKFKAEHLLSKAFALTQESFILEIKQKISKNESEGIFHAAWQTVAHAVMFFPFFANKFDYAVAFFFAVYPIIGLKIASTYVNSSASSRSGGTGTIPESYSLSMPSSAKSLEGSFEGTTQDDDELIPPPPRARSGKETFSARFQRKLHGVFNKQEVIDAENSI